MPEVKPPAGYTLDTPVTPPPGYSLDAPAGPKSAVAPGTSDDDLIKRFGFDPTVIKSSPRYQAAAKQYGSGVSFMLTNPVEHPQLQAWRNAPVVGQVEDVGMGANDVLNGIMQLARHGAGKLGMLSDADVQYGDLLDRVRNQDYLQNVRQGNASPALRFLGNVLMPVPAGGLLKGGSTAATVARAALQGAAVGAAQPVESSTPENYWTKKAEQTAIGAVSGPVLHGAVAGAGKVAGKFINAAAGNIPEQAADVLQEGQHFGVRVLPGDVTRNPILQKAETLLESVPVLGTSGERAAQHGEAAAAAGKLRGNLRRDFQQTALGGFDDVLEAADTGDEAARQLVDKLQNAGNDPDKILQASIGLSNFRTRQTATGLYDKVQELVEKHNLPEVPLPKTTEAVQQALSRVRLSKLPDRQLMGILSDIKQGIAPKKVSAVPAPNPSGNVEDAWSDAFQAPGTITKPAGNFYGVVRQLRSDLGDKIRMYLSGENALIGEKGIGQLQQVRNALEQDLANFTRSSGVPEVQQAAASADSYYKAARVPFKDGMLAQAAVTTEPDQIFQQFIKAGKGDRAQKFYDALDPKGQAAVRYSMVADAVNKATDSGKGTFSPQKFYSAMDKLDEAYGVFFKGMDQWQVSGFKNLMAHITRAGQFAENPPTGNRAVPLIWAGLTGAAAHANLPATAGVAGLLAIAKPLMMSDGGKRFLLAASGTKPGSLAMQNLIDQMGAKLATAPKAQQIE